MLEAMMLFRAAQSRRFARLTLGSMGLAVALILLSARPAGANGDGQADAAWAAAQATAGAALYRPSWLPSRFSEPPALLSRDKGIGVTYRDSSGDMLTVMAGASEGCERVRSVEEVTVRGVQGSLTVRDCSPRFAVRWSESGQAYSILIDGPRGETGITRDELLRIVSSLKPVGANGAVEASASGVIDEVTGLRELRLGLLGVLASILIVLERPRILQLAALARR